MNKINVFFFVVFLLVTICWGHGQTRVSYTHQQMGTQIGLVFYAPDSVDADSVAKLVFDRIDGLNLVLSDYLPKSELNRLSETVNIKVKLSQDLYQILRLSVSISEKTGGAFDSSMGPVIALWKNAKKNGSLPTYQEIESARKRTGFKKLEFFGDGAVRLKASGMQLDVGGIGKGYAADKAIELLKDLGVNSALVDMGGDVTVSGAPPDKEYWVLGFSYYDANGAEVFTKLKLRNQAVATSGDLYQYFVLDGKRYSHIVDPNTGTAITNNIQVTAIAPNGTMADAYASALSVMGVVNGQKLQKEIPGLEVFMVEDIPDSYLQWNSPGFLDYIINDQSGR